MDQHRGSPRDRRLRVLESFRTPRSTTNPYLTLLLRSLPPDVEALTFDWSTALAGRYDVLHLHWPDVVVKRRHPARALAVTLLFVLVLVRCRLTGTAVVRTAHNITPHEEAPRLTRLVLRLCDRWTTWWIRLNETTPTPPGAPVTTILHGHFRDWLAEPEPAGTVPGRTASGSESPDPVPGRLVSFGLIRPYKGMDQLVDAFEGSTGDLSLRVLGRPATPGAADTVRALAARDARVRLRLEHVPDGELADEIRQAELVVLPYTQMHNSSTVLLALSLDRPVLVPANDVTDALAREVGAGFVLRYGGRLTTEALERAVAEVRSDGPGVRPDLSGREWALIGAQHGEVFRSAARLRRSAARPSGRDPAG